MSIGNIDATPISSELGKLELTTPKPIDAEAERSVLSYSGPYVPSSANPTVYTDKSVYLLV